jgi:ABC-type enterochelin transport system substrate-binding protein
MLIDVKTIQETARKEIVEEATKRATEKLKELYGKLEKAKLVVRNIEREIDAYLNEVSDLSVYEAAGVDVSE